MTDHPGPAEQQPKETAPAFEAFRTYLEAGPGRSTAKVARALGKSKTLIDRWSSRNGWQARVREFEATATRVVDDAHLTEIARRARRQAEIAQLHGEATALVARAVVQKIAADPNVLNGLALDELLRIEAAMARAHNRVVVTERLALGMTTNQDGEPLPRAAAEEQARRLTDLELDARLAGVDEVAQKREERRGRNGRVDRDVAGDG
jgi:hypothetical protein